MSRAKTAKTARTTKAAKTAKSQRHRKEPDPLARRIGAKIKRLRGEREISFDAFVEETGLGRGYISELERGLVVPTVVSLSKVARVLEVTLADLVLGDSLREQIFEAMLESSLAELDRVAGVLRGGVRRSSSLEKPVRTPEPRRPATSRRRSSSLE